MTKATELRGIADFANKRGEKYENEQASFLYGSWLDKMKEAAKSGEYSMELRAFPKERSDYAIIERARNLLSSNGFDVDESEVSNHFYTNPVTEKIDGEAMVSFSVNWAV